MKRRKAYWHAAIVGCLALFVAVAPAWAEDLTAKGCDELLRMAQTYEQDLKTVNTVLGSAIDGGNMDRIRNYKLKRAEVQRRLKSVLRVIDLKECVLKR